MFSKKRISITNITSIGGGASSSSGAGEKRSLASTVASTVRRLSITSSISTVETQMADYLALSQAQQPRQQSCMKLIERHAWDDLRRLLADVTQHATEVHNTITAESSHSAYILEALPSCVLHAACCNHAPIDILRSIHSLRASTVTDVDSNDRTALHHAAAAWNEPAVIKFLLRRNGDAASHQDSDGCTPLHLCVHPKDITDGGRLFSSARSQMNTKEPPLVRIIHYLCCVSPASATMDDDEECTPIEYAIESELPLLAVQVLRKASETAWKRQEECKKRRATMSILSMSTASRRPSAAGQNLLVEGKKADECNGAAASPMPPNVRERQTIRRTSAKSA